jgi:hypothetical protein
MKKQGMSSVTWKKSYSSNHGQQQQDKPAAGSAEGWGDTRQRTGLLVETECRQAQTVALLHGAEHKALRGCLIRNLLSNSSAQLPAHDMSQFSGAAGALGFNCLLLLLQRLTQKQHVRFLPPCMNHYVYPPEMAT